MIINNIDVSDWFKVKQDIKGRGVIDKELSMTSLPGENGTVIQSRRYPHRPLDIPFTISCRSKPEKNKRIDELNSILANNQLTMIFEDMPDVTFICEYAGLLEYNEKAYRVDGRLSFVCADAFKRGRDREVNISSSKGTVHVGGTAPTKAVFSFVIKQAANHLLLKKGTKYVRLNRNFVAGDRVIIDFSKELIILNNNNAQQTLALTSRYFSFIHGANEIEYSPQADLKVTFTEKWL